MKLSIYRSLLSKKRAVFVASIGKCGYGGYREIQVRRLYGVFYFEILDGFKTLQTGTVPSLKHATTLLKSFYSGE